MEVIDRSTFRFYQAYILSILVQTSPRKGLHYYRENVYGPLNIWCRYFATYGIPLYIYIPLSIYNFLLISLSNIGRKYQFHFTVVAHLNCELIVSSSFNIHCRIFLLDVTPGM